MLILKEPLTIEEALYLYHLGGKDAIRSITSREYLEAADCFMAFLNKNRWTDTKDRLKQKFQGTITNKEMYKIVIPYCSNATQEIIDKDWE